MKPTYLFSTSSHPDAISVNSLDILFFQPKIHFSNYDYLIISSKQISYALQQYKYESYKDKKALCVSKKTAFSFQKIDGEVLDIGNGYGDDLLKKISSHPKETKWLYLKGKIVASDFVSRAKSMGYNIDEVIMYESKCSQKIKDVSVEKNSTLIFTSPSSIECFLKNKKICNTHKVIVIGKTTAKALPKDISYIISKDNSIESCLKLV